ncbi:MAG: YbhB/YbcL family Raf kinase inhibitor-like protein, partial [Spirochaetes bacterium]|nr:YbhB/YbcL family Raf kinase inhibitor-like protein [Spirochaetota bacterium]
WVHWVVYNIPAQCRKIPEGINTNEKISLRDGISFTQGITSWNKTGYGGPCPPKGTGVHHYHFRLYALSLEPTLPGGLTKKALMNAIKDYIIAETQLIGVYEKK